MKKLVLYLLWLACQNICVKCTEESDKTAVTSDTTTKEKRYLHHGVLPHIDSSSPCPPIEPHYHAPTYPMYPIKPFNPPIYQKPIYGPPKAPLNHGVQLIHQPTYMSYVPKQQISYVNLKPQISMPLYHYLPTKPMIHQEQPIQHLVKQHTQWQLPQPHVVNYEKPHFVYAPTYHKPMIQQVPYMKSWSPPLNYHTLQANNFITKPAGIVYKSDSHYCEPCHQTLHKPLQHKLLPQIIHAPPSYVKPVIHPAPAPPPAPVKPAPYYLPSKPLVQLPIIKHTAHDYPCTK